ncbi:hypothetical protein Tco_0422895 [Tanacetum coccineum]
MMIKIPPLGTGPGGSKEEGQTKRTRFYSGPRETDNHNRERLLLQHTRSLKQVVYDEHAEKRLLFRTGFNNFRLPSPDHAWNKSVHAVHGIVQPCYEDLGCRLRHIKMDSSLSGHNSNCGCQMIVKYDKFALWGISHWGKKRRQFYAFATTRESARDDERNVLYIVKEGDFHRLRIQDIEDMLFFSVMEKWTISTFEERIVFNVSLRMFTRSVVIQRRVEDL